MATTITKKSLCNFSYGIINIGRASKQENKRLGCIESQTHSQCCSPELPEPSITKFLIKITELAMLFSIFGHSRKVSFPLTYFFKKIQLFTSCDKL